VSLGRRFSEREFLHTFAHQGKQGWSVIKKNHVQPHLDNHILCGVRVLQAPTLARTDETRRDSSSITSWLAGLHNPRRPKRPAMTAPRWRLAALPAPGDQDSHGPASRAAGCPKLAEARP